MYAQSTIKRARTILANEAASKRTVQRTVKAERADWRDGKASIGQMRRINARYRAMGLREFASLASFRKVFGSAGAASAEWKSIRGF